MELNPCETTILMNMEIFPKFWGENEDSWNQGNQHLYIQAADKL